ncbi:MAG: DUF1501 domain-containing protein [Myxococcota bacterium]
MNRRDFLTRSLLAGIGLSWSPHARARVRLPGPQESGPTLVVLNLLGGPDFRHIFTPRYDPSDLYSETFWRAKARSHSLDPADTAGLAARAESYIVPVAQEHQYFGIHPDCGWLAGMFNQGHVAIVNNVYGSTNRDHVHSTLILESGNPDSGPRDNQQSGWGGRLAHACDRNIVSVSNFVRPVCYGPSAINPLGHDNARVIGASDSRNMGLYEFNGGLYEFETGRSDWQSDRRGYMSRALTSYYAAKSGTLPIDSPYRHLLQSEASLRTFGARMKDLLNASLEASELPEALVGLYGETSPTRLNSLPFGLQVRNIYDILNAREVLEANVISAEYGGWDHHRTMRELIEPALEDIFGSQRGLDTLYSALPAETTEDLILVVYGEFGRQLVANGDEGVDHGVGNSMLVIGERVRGGVYGDMFPLREVTEGAYDEPGADIEGLTAFHQVLGRVCEHMKPGSAEDVLPGWSTSALELGLDLDQLFG